MMDDFEKHIRDNKGHFDEPAPDKMKMWENISGKLAKEKKTVVLPLWKRTSFRVAASLLLLVGTSLFFLNNRHSKSKLQASNEYIEVNSHYGQLVALQIKKLNASEALSDKEKRDFLGYIDELNQEQNRLKNELERNLDNEEILEAIIKNFNQQIGLIEQLLDRLNQVKSKKDETGISL